MLLTWSGLTTVLLATARLAGALSVPAQASESRAFVIPKGIAAENDLTAFHAFVDGIAPFAADKDYALDEYDWEQDPEDVWGTIKRGLIRHGPTIARQIVKHAPKVIDYVEKRLARHRQFPSYPEEAYSLDEYDGEEEDIIGALVGGALLHFGPIVAKHVIKHAPGVIGRIRRHFGGRGLDFASYQDYLDGYDWEQDPEDFWGLLPHILRHGPALAGHLIKHLSGHGLDNAPYQDYTDEELEDFWGLLPHILRHGPALAGHLIKHFSGHGLDNAPYQDYTDEELEDIWGTILKHVIRHGPTIAKHVIKHAPAVIGHIHKHFGGRGLDFALNQDDALDESDYLMSPGIVRFPTPTFPHFPSGLGGKHWEEDDVFGDDDEGAALVNEILDLLSVGAMADLD